MTEQDGSVFSLMIINTFVGELLTMFGDVHQQSERVFTSHIGDQAAVEAMDFSGWTVVEKAKVNLSVYIAIHDKIIIQFK